MANNTVRHINIIGHQNPDTDSICSALAYAWLKNRGSLTDLFALPFNHHPVIESGLLEDEAQSLLQDFFVMLREKRKKK